MRVAALAAALTVWIAGCTRPVPAPEPGPPPPPRDEPVVVLEAPAGSGLRSERPALLRVIDAVSGAGVANAEVRGPGGSERTDADGFCELPRDAGKPRAWTATAEGYAPGVANGVVGGAVLPLHRAGPVQLRVLDTFDRPVDGARIALVGWLRPQDAGTAPPDFELQRTAAGPGGAGAFRAAGPWQYVRGSAPKHLTKEVRVADLPRDATGPVLRLPQWPAGDYTPQSPSEPAGLEVELRDARTLSPIAGAMVRLEAFGASVATYAARTGPGGIARVRCPAGEYGCVPLGPFESHTFDRVNVVSSADRRRFLVRATPNPQVSVQVRGAPEAVVLTLAVDGGQREVRAEEFVPVRAALPMVLSASGAGWDLAWAVAPLEPGLQFRTFHADWPDHARAPSRSPGGGAGPPKPRAPSGALGSVLVDIRDPQGRFLSGRASVDGRWGGTGSRVTIERIPAGPHRVVIWADGREVLVEPVTVQPGATTRLLARLRPLE